MAEPQLIAKPQRITHTAYDPIEDRIILRLENGNHALVNCEDCTRGGPLPGDFLLTFARGEEN